MALFRNTRTDQLATVFGVVADHYDAKEHWERVDEVNVGDLKGKALDEQLENAGLPKSGKVAEKQARLAEHLANSGHEDEEEVDPDLVTTTIPSQDQ